MINLINDKFNNIPRSTFFKRSAFICFLADTMNLVYINSYWLKDRLDLKSLKRILSFNGLNSQIISNSDLQNYRYILIGSITNTLMIFTAVHIVIYYLLSREKNWTKKYVGGYCLSAVLLTITQIYAFIDNLNSWSILLIISSFMYLYVFMGLKYFKKQEQ